MLNPLLLYRHQYILIQTSGNSLEHVLTVLYLTSLIIPQILITFTISHFADALSKANYWWGYTFKQFTGAVLFVTTATIIPLLKCYFKKNWHNPINSSLFECSGHVKKIKKGYRTDGIYIYIYIFLRIVNVMHCCMQFLKARVFRPLLTVCVSFQ